MAESAAVQALLDRARAALPGPATAPGVAPGRVNLLGEHTDYIGGLALPAAVDRHIVVALRPREDDRVQVRALDLDQVHGWTLRAPPQPGQVQGWVAYVAGAVALATAPGGPPTGFDAAVCGDVPLGSGISSSAALCLAWLCALDAWTGTERAPLDRARLAQQVEHAWAGVHCGLLDQVASQCARDGEALRVDFRDLSLAAAPSRLSGQHWLLLHTGVSRTLAGSAYQERVAQVTLGLRRSGAAHWRDLPGPGGLETLAQRLGDPLLLRRLRHGITENARVEAAVGALAAGDAATLGRLLDESHASLRDDYAVSCAELDAMQAAARSQPGCHGARMMGGGFGGCVLALVDDGAPVAAAALQAYRARFADLPARALPVRAVGGARGLADRKLTNW